MSCTEIEQLVRLMWLCLVSSWKAERSFSSLKMTEVAVCHVHQDILDTTDISKIDLLDIRDLEVHVYQCAILTFYVL